MGQASAEQADLPHRFCVALTDTSGCVFLGGHIAPTHETLFWEIDAWEHRIKDQEELREQLELGCMGKAVMLSALPSSLEIVQ